MMDIEKHFTSSKKPKDKEATSSSSYSDHNVFEEGLDSSNCRRHKQRSNLHTHCTKTWKI